MKTLKLNVGDAFEVRANKKLVDIETTDKQWKVQFGNKTKEYALTMYILENKDEEGLKGLVMRLFHTRMTVIDAEFSNMFGDLLRTFYETRMAKASEVSKEEDDKILNEERALHEK